MDVFALESFRGTPLCRDPFDYVIVPGFVLPEALRRINADYPAIEHAGSFPLSVLKFGPGFQEMVDALESEEFREAFKEKFHVDLRNRATTLTVRGRCGPGDGKIHNDSTSKIISILIYMNSTWDAPGGRLRLLRSEKNIEDVAAEVPPSEGALVAFLRSDNSWHGHLPFVGERRVVQFNWVLGNRSKRVSMWRHALSARVKRMLKR